MSDTLDLNAAPGYLPQLSFSTTRTRLKDALNLVESGRLIEVRRSNHSSASLIGSHILKDLLMRANEHRVPEVTFSRDDEVGTIATLFLRGTPVAVEASSMAEAVDRFVADLREYVADWAESPALQHAVNHRDNQLLILMVQSMTDQELAQWVVTER